MRCHPVWPPTWRAWTIASDDKVWGSQWESFVLGRQEAENNFTEHKTLNNHFNVTPRKPECTDKVKKSKWISCRSVFLHTDNLSVTRANIIFFRFFLPMHFAPRAELKYFHGPLYEPELIDWGDRWFEIVTEGGQGVPCGEWRQDMSCIRGDIVVMGRRQGD